MVLSLFQSKLACRPLTMVGEELLDKQNPLQIYIAGDLCVILVLLSGQPFLGLEGLERFSHRVV